MGLFTTPSILKPVDTKNKPQKTTECRRCGTCCKDGGPALHGEDRTLIESGRIPLKCLYTIRSGERIRDNVKGGLFQATGDIIKIKGGRDFRACRFWDATQGNRCTIYGQRPLECRVLKCWDTTALEDIYGTNRLTRSDLLSQMEGLYELVADHERQCAYGDVHKYIQDLEEGHRTAEAIRHVLAMIRYDQQLRGVMSAKANLDPEMMDFLLGRPMTQILPGLELRLVKIDGAWGLEYHGKQYAARTD